MIYFKRGSFYCGNVLFPGKNLSLLLTKVRSIHLQTVEDELWHKTEESLSKVIGCGQAVTHLSSGAESWLSHLNTISHQMNVCRETIDIIRKSMAR